MDFSEVEIKGKKKKGKGKEDPQAESEAQNLTHMKKQIKEMKKKELEEEK